MAVVKRTENYQKLSLIGLSKSDQHPEITFSFFMSLSCKAAMFSFNIIFC